MTHSVSELIHVVERILEENTILFRKTRFGCFIMSSFDEKVLKICPIDSIFDSLLDTCIIFFGIDRYTHVWRKNPNPLLIYLRNCHSNACR